MTTVVLSDAIDMMVFKPSGGTNRFLYINGDINNEAFAYRIQLPDRADTPRRATNKDMPLSGYLITPYMDWDRAQVQKSADRWTAISESLSGGETLTVDYQSDDSTTWTNINASLSVFNTSPHQAIVVDDGVTLRRIRFRLTFAASSSNNSGVLKAFAFEANWRPPRLRVWRMTAALEAGARAITGVSNELPLARQINRLSRLKNEVSPIKMVDIDNDEHRCHIIDMSESQVRVRQDADRTRYARGLHIVIRETRSLQGGVWDTDNWDEFYWG